MKTSKLHLAGTLLAVIACAAFSTTACSSDDPAPSRPGTGGTTGTTGGTTGGDTGGTTSVVPGVCGLNTPPSGSLVMDWECLVNDEVTGEPNIGWTPVNDFGHGSYFYYNEAPGATDTWVVGEETFTGGLVAGHTGDNALGVDMVKPATNWGCGVGIWMGGNLTEGDPSVKECIDVSAATGISMWVKGYLRNEDDTPATNEDGSSATVLEVSFSTQATSKMYDDAGVYTGGGCDLGEACAANKYALDMADKSDWTQVSIPWSSLTGGSAAFDPKELMGINIHVMGNWGALQKLQFHIDDVELIGAGASQLPRTCEEPTP